MRGPRGVRVVTEPAESGQAPQRRCAGLGFKDEGRGIRARGYGSWGYWGKRGSEESVNLKVWVEPGHPILKCSAGCV